MNIATSTTGTVVALGLLGLALSGCTRDDGLQPFFGNTVSVTAGDFDNVAEPLQRAEVHYEMYDGIISTATWDQDLEHEQLALEVESLLTDPTEMGNGFVFVASGTRGLGDRQYNGLQQDDHLVSDPSVPEAVDRFVTNGGTLVVTDWGYDLIEATWPDAIDFLNDDTRYDAAQKGVIGTIVADVVDPDLAEALDMDEMGVAFNYSNWAVMTEVGDDVDVLMRGTVTWRQDSSTEPEVVQDVPLMVSFQPRGASGRVIFMSYHIDAQTHAVIDTILAETVGSFDPPEGESTQVNQ